MPGSCPNSCAALNVMHSLSLTPHPHLPLSLTSQNHLPHRFTSYPHLPHSLASHPHLPHSLTPHPHLPHRLTSHPHVPQRLTSHNHLPHRFTSHTASPPHLSPHIPSHPHLPQPHLPWVLRPNSTVLEENIQEADVGGVDLDVVLGSMGKCQWQNGNRGILRGLGLHSTLAFPRLSAAGVDAPLPADTYGLTALDRLSWFQGFRILNPPASCHPAQQARKRWQAAHRRR